MELVVFTDDPTGQLNRKENLLRRLESEGLVPQGQDGVVDHSHSPCGGHPPDLLFLHFILLGPSSHRCGITNLQRSWPPLDPH